MGEKIFAVAELTFRKIKEPAFLILFIFAGLIGYCVSEMESLSFQYDNILFSQLFLPQKGVSILTGFLLVLSIAMLIGVFSGATDIPRDIETKMIMLILGKPVRRTEYLVGKYIGITGICIAFFIAAVLFINVGHLIKTGEFYSFQTNIRQFFFILAIFPFVAMTIMISCFFSDLSAMLLTAAYMLFSISFSTIPLLVELLPEKIGVDVYLYIFYYFFPNYFYYLQPFNMIGLASLSLIIYSCSLTAVFLVIGSWRLNSRDMA